MGEPTVQVPVSLIEGHAAFLDRAGYTATANQMRALLSQPTPTAETVACPHWEPGQITMRNGCTACGADATPPSIADMVPGKVARP